MANVPSEFSLALNNCLTSFAEGADQTGRDASRKKRRSKRKTIMSDFEDVQTQRVREVWKLQLSNRRFRRWLNDQLLRERAPRLDEQDIGSLFAPPPWGERNTHTPFERVTGMGGNAAHDMVVWEPFRNDVDMDFEAHILQPVIMPQKKTSNKVDARYAMALAAWCSIEHRIRNVLRQCSCWQLVHAFEEKIISYLRERDKGVDHMLVMEVDDPYHRLLVHGLSQFHGLLSHSVSAWEKGENGNTFFVKKMYIKKTKIARQRGSSEAAQSEILNLLEFLKQAKQQVPSSGVAA